MMPGDLVPTELAGSNAIVLGGLQTMGAQNFAKTVRTWAGHMLGCYILEATVGLKNTGVVGHDVTNPSVICSFLKETQITAPASAKGAGIRMGNPRGIDLAIVGWHAGWRRVLQYVDTTTSDPDFPSYGTIGAGATVTRILRWYFPFALPIRGKYAWDTALAAGDAEQVQFSFMTEAQMSAVTHADIVYDPVSPPSYRVLGVFQRPSKGGVLGLPLEIYRQTLAVQSDIQDEAVGNLVFAYADATNGQTVTNVIDSLDRPGSDLRDGEQVQYHDLLRLLELERANMCPQLPPASGDPAQTVSRFPLYSLPRDSQLSELETARLAYKLQTPMEHQLVTVRIVPSPSGEPPEVYAAKRARIIDTNEGTTTDSEKTAVVVPEGRPSTANILHKVPFIRMPADAVVKAATRKVKTLAAAQGTRVQPKKKAG